MTDVRHGTRLRVEVMRYPDDPPRPGRWPYPVVALGNFDGMHRGHQKILERVCRQARERHGTPLVMTFDPHPPRVLRPDKAPPLLMTTPQRIEALARAGIEGVALVTFDHELSRLDPDTFVRRVLVGWLGVAEVWVGGNFLFGRDRTGNFSMLRSLGARYGFRSEKIDPVRYKEFVVSSTRIRRLISEGRVDEAGALLGHPYAIDGVVVRGDGRGRTLGYPTANLATDNELLPPNGVYATTVRLDGVIYPSVTNIGVRPTFGDDGRAVVETHLLGAEMDLYGRSVGLGFVQRVRDERRFDSVDQLTAQIALDVQKTRTLFDRMSL
jgi:riboflavin kinase/FMN adenylyltransferase